MKNDNRNNESEPTNPLAGYQHFLDNQRMREPQKKRYNDFSAQQKEQDSEISEEHIKKKFDAEIQKNIATASLTTPHLLAPLELRVDSELGHLLDSPQQHPDIDSKIFKKDQDALNRIFQHYNGSIDRISGYDAKLGYLRALAKPEKLATKLGNTALTTAIKEHKTLLQSASTDKENLAEKSQTKIMGLIKNETVSLKLQLQHLIQNVDTNDPGTQKKILELNDKMVKCQLLEHVIKQRENNNSPEDKAARSKQINRLKADKRGALRDLHTKTVTGKHPGDIHLIKTLSKSSNSNLKEFLNQLTKSEAQLNNEYMWCNTNFEPIEHPRHPLLTKDSYYSSGRATFKQAQIIRSRYSRVVMTHIMDKEERGYQASDIHGGIPGPVIIDFNFLCLLDIEEVVAELQAEGHSEIRIKSELIKATGEWKCVLEVKSKGKILDKAIADRNTRNKNKVEAEENQNAEIQTSKSANQAYADEHNPETKLDAEARDTPPSPRGPSSSG